MPDGNDQHVIKVIGGLSNISADDWNGCAGTDNPFVSHEFLSALEDSGSATADTGWMAQHIALYGPDGSIQGCAPVYVKTHSYGEYVFDWGWADAYERAGGQYYPKLQCAVPFTPAPGPRLLVDQTLSDERQRENRTLLAAGIAQLADQLELSSAHITFCEKQTWDDLGKGTYLQRVGQQFHWLNDDYKTFDDFLGALSSRKRKSIRKERQKVNELGLDIRALSGSEIKERYWDAFYQFYLATTDKKWGESYLRRSFFSLLGERLGDRVVLIMAFDGDRPVAGALNLKGNDCLYGRNWGCLETHKFLHFECCYYKAIDYAIEHGLARVEAGAQGPHKVQRGYLPEMTYSLHYIRDQGFSDAVGDFVRRERQSIENEATYIRDEHSPYKKSSS